MFDVVLVSFLAVCMFEESHPDDDDLLSKRSFVLQMQRSLFPDAKAAEDTL